MQTGLFQYNFESKQKLSVLLKHPVEVGCF